LQHQAQDIDSRSDFKTFGERQRSQLRVQVLVTRITGKQSTAYSGIRWSNFELEHLKTPVEWNSREIPVIVRFRNGIGDAKSKIDHILLDECQLPNLLDFRKRRKSYSDSECLPILGSERSIQEHRLWLFYVHKASKT